MTITAWGFPQARCGLAPWVPAAACLMLDDVAITMPEALEGPA